MSCTVVVVPAIALQSTPVEMDLRATADCSYSSDRPSSWAAHRSRRFSKNLRASSVQSGRASAYTLDILAFRVTAILLGFVLSGETYRRMVTEKPQPLSLVRRPT